MIGRRLAFARFRSLSRAIRAAFSDATLRFVDVPRGGGEPLDTGESSIEKLG